MNYEIKGELIKKFDTETFASGFQKRSAVIRTEGNYPQEVLVEFTQDKTDLLDTHNIGDKVTVGFNLNGRKWTSPQGEDKWFNTINGWKIIAENAATQQSPAPYQAPQEQPKQENPFEEDEDDTLPF